MLDWKNEHHQHYSMPTSPQKEAYRDHATSLNEHVVDGCGDSTCSDAVGVRRRPRHLNGMHVWVAGDQRDDGEVDPWGGVLIERVQRDQEWKRIYLQQGRRDDATIDDLAEVTENEEREQADHFGRDTE